MPDSVVGGVVTCQVKVNGAAIPGAYPLYSLRIEQALNRISTAHIAFLDGDPAAESFAISASSSFVPGNEVSIEVGYDGRNTELFAGIVTKQSIRVAAANGPLLEVECKDKAVKMTVGRKSANFDQQTDSAVIGSLIAAASLASEVTATANVLPTLVQYYVSDWDFMLARAEVNGMVVTAVNNKVTVFDPTAATSPATTLTYGGNILDFRAELNALTQLAKVTASAWSFQSQQLISAEANNTLSGPGNLSSKDLAAVAGLDSFQLQTTATETDAELMTWAKAQMLKSALSKITGEVRFLGATVAPGQYVTLAGLGARFDGDHIVSSVRHEVADGNWTTEAGLGLSAMWFTQEHAVEAPAAAGLLPGIGGLFNATVKRIADDPESEFRILVEVALLDAKATGFWARLSNFYSTNGQGTFFLPEVGDEVILGFLNQDPCYPVILGSMYSQKNVPFNQFSPNAQNSMKGIVSKSALRMLFDDENVVLSLVTPKGKTAVLDDKNGTVSIKDELGNSIVMSSSGISIKSDKDISIEAGQNVTISGQQGIALSSDSGDVTTSGINVTQTAGQAFAAQGQAKAEVQGGATLTLKAAMVLIN